MEDKNVALDGKIARVNLELITTLTSLPTLNSQKKIERPRLAVASLTRSQMEDLVMPMPTSIKIGVQVTNVSQSNGKLPTLSTRLMITRGVFVTIKALEKPPALKQKVTMKNAPELLANATESTVKTMTMTMMT